MVEQDMIDKLIMLGGVAAEAAEAIEDLLDLLEVKDRALNVRSEREGYKRYLEYWRDKHGYGELNYPDADEIYKEYWLLRERNEDLEMMIADLKTVNLSLEAINSDLENKMSYMINPNAIGDRHEMGCW